MEEERNKYRTLVGAYLGIQSIDEYDLKAYVLKDIELLIDNYKKDKDIDFKREDIDVLNNVSIRVKLQDALNILNEINGDKELMHLIRMRLKKKEEILW